MGDGSLPGCSEYTKGLKIGRRTDDEGPTLVNLRNTWRVQKIDLTVPLLQHFDVVDKVEPAHNSGPALTEVCYIVYDLGCRDIVAGVGALGHSPSDNLWG